jgi:hypothetical protein
VTRSGVLMIGHADPKAFSSEKAARAACVAVYLNLLEFRSMAGKVI